MAQKAYEPTDKDRLFVQTCASLGIAQARIAKLVGISIPTLEKYYREELDTAADRADAEVFNTLYRMATSGKEPAATIFWMKVRRQWREKDQAEGEKQQPPSTIVLNVMPKPDK